MNKYMGFYELKNLNVPTVPWEVFTEDTILNGNLLWTMRVAVERGSDYNLPRFVGVSADDACKEGKKLLARYKDSGIIIYYPYFIAEKSGVIDINSSRIVIEAVRGDLWNLVTYGNKNVTITLKDDVIQYDGEKDFLSINEIQEFLKHISLIKYKFKGFLDEGKSIFMEWSFAYNTDTNRRAVGDRYLVFYEMRSV